MKYFEFVVNRLEESNAAGKKVTFAVGDIFEDELLITLRTEIFII